MVPSPFNPSKLYCKYGVLRISQKIKEPSKITKQLMFIDKKVLSRRKCQFLHIDDKGLNDTIPLWSRQCFFCVLSSALKAAAIVIII